jgi:hypothetical protein
MATKRKPRYKVLDDDEIVVVPINVAPYSIRLTCCDCGLTHDVRILTHPKLKRDTVEMIFSRNRKVTTKQRKGKNGISFV